MAGLSIKDASVTELRTALDRRDMGAAELTRAVLDDIESRDSRYGAFLRVLREGALKQAEEAEKRIAHKRDVRPLTGIPLALKDNILAKDELATAGSRFLESFVAPFDSTVVTRLRKAGAVFVGRTNLDEFAMGSSNENSAFGAVRNPWDTTRVPGGSSGGSAAAVAAREVPLALGTDTGGSVRQPAAFCGIVGLKPTYGRVSRYGVVAFASSFDQVGPMARRVEDCATLFVAIGGHDPLESTSADVPMAEVSRDINEGIKGLKIGFPKEYLPEALDGEVKANFTKALRTCESLGASVEEVSLPHTDYAVACYYILATAEASANLARYDGVRYTRRALNASSLSDLFTQSRTEGFGAEVKRRIMLGTFVLSSGYYDAYYRKGQEVRTLVQKDFLAALSSVDTIVTPVSPTPAFPLGSRIEDPLQMYLSDIFTVGVSLSGLPGLVVPSGFTSGGLPLGLQLVGRPFDEAALFRAGKAFEDATRHFERRPPK